MRQLLTSREVAQRLGHSIEWFYANYRRLKREDFPDPVPAAGRRWDPRAIELWQDQVLLRANPQLAAAAALAEAKTKREEEVIEEARLEADRAELERRIDAMRTTAPKPSRARA